MIYVSAFDFVGMAGVVFVGARRTAPRPVIGSTATTIPGRCTCQSTPIVYGPATLEVRVSLDIEPRQTCQWPEYV